MQQSLWQVFAYWLCLPLGCYRSNSQVVYPLQAFLLAYMAYYQSVDRVANHTLCLLYTSDAADEEDSVDLGGRRIIKKKKK